MVVDVGGGRWPNRSAALRPGQCFRYSAVAAVVLSAAPGAVLAAATAVAAEEVLVVSAPWGTSCTDRHPCTGPARRAGSTLVT